MSEDMSGNFFKIGIITNSVGLKGELRVYPTTDTPERFSELSGVYARGTGGVSDFFEIEHARYQKGLVILKLKGVDDVDAALRLKTRELLIPPELALPLGQDEYYHRDLLDMRVFNAENESLGIISGILETGANDVYVVKRPGGGEFMLPAVREFIISVDVSGKVMVIKPPNGLLEL